jgi:hypothetical protein
MGIRPLGQPAQYFAARFVGGDASLNEVVRQIIAESTGPNGFAYLGNALTLGSNGRIGCGADLVGDGRRHLALHLILIFVFHG